MINFWIRLGHLPDFNTKTPFYSCFAWQYLDSHLKEMLPAQWMCCPKLRTMMQKQQMGKKWNISVSCCCPRNGVLFRILLGHVQCEERWSIHLCVCVRVCGSSVVDQVESPPSCPGSANPSTYSHKYHVEVRTHTLLSHAEYTHTRAHVRTHITHITLDYKILSHPTEHEF